MRLTDRGFQGHPVGILFEGDFELDGRAKRSRPLIGVIELAPSRVTHVERTLLGSGG